MTSASLLYFFFINLDEIVGAFDHLKYLLHVHGQVECNALIVGFRQNVELTTTFFQNASTRSYAIIKGVI